MFSTWRVNYLSVVLNIDLSFFLYYSYHHMRILKPNLSVETSQDFLLQLNFQNCEFPKEVIEVSGTGVFASPFVFA